MEKKRRRFTKKQGFALFLTVAMCVGLIPFTVFGEGDKADTHTHNEDGWECVENEILTCTEEHEHGDGCYEAVWTCRPPKDEVTGAQEDGKVPEQEGDLQEPVDDSSAEDTGEAEEGIPGTDAEAAGSEGTAAEPAEDEVGSEETAAEMETLGAEAADGTPDQGIRAAADEPGEAEYTIVFNLESIETKVNENGVTNEENIEGKSEKYPAGTWQVELHDSEDRIKLPNANDIALTPPENHILAGWSTDENANFIKTGQSQKARIMPPNSFYYPEEKGTATLYAIYVQNTGALNGNLKVAVRKGGTKPGGEPVIVIGGDYDVLVGNGNDPMGNVDIMKYLKEARCMAYCPDEIENNFTDELVGLIKKGIEGKNLGYAYEDIEWYVIKNQQEPLGWHIDGIVKKAGTVQLKYYANCPDGTWTGVLPDGEEKPLKDENGNVCRVWIKRGTIERPGYKFLGWKDRNSDAYYSVDGQWENQGELIMCTVDIPKDILLDAQWEPIELPDLPQTGGIGIYRVCGISGLLVMGISLCGLQFFRMRFSKQ